MSTTNVNDAGWMTPSPRLWRMRCLEVGVSAVVLAVVSVIGGVVNGSSHASVVGVAVGVGLLVLGGLLLFPVYRRFRAWSYQEREEDLVVSRGVMFRRESVVPYGRMQFVDVTAGPIERVFKLATVKLHTAAAASDARIPGLEKGEAARLRDRLAELGEARAAGL
jgi:membrane protein YdbS with pleckstrin-like domain